ncbi:hypothetical protein [Solidesulfovibrio alcoholivorans]|uniref:hypothetical protein n=1 Tax=Solidesulfovibrio alcoholivorans TaxID=81406 RepID=UPI0004979ADD|nr:hypothetical protein [Solidesulfovibrio alcoholivorans]
MTTTLGFSLELSSGALTTHVGLPSGAACVHDGAVLLADADGLYRVGGDDDAGVAIAARAALPATDCGLPGAKRLVGVAVEGVVAGELAVSAQSGADASLCGRLGPSGEGNFPGRATARLARGYGTAWRVALENVDGAALDIGAIALAVVPLDRRRP